MKYLVKVVFTNVAHIEVNAKNADEAHSIVNNSFGCVMNNAHCSVGDEVIPNWNLPIHPDKKIEWVKIDR